MFRLLWGLRRSERRSGLAVPAQSSSWRYEWRRPLAWFLTRGPWSLLHLWGYQETSRAAKFSGWRFPISFFCARCSSWWRLRWGICSCWYPCTGRAKSSHIQWCQLNPWRWRSLISQYGLPWARTLLEATTTFSHLGWTPWWLLLESIQEIRQDGSLDPPPAPHRRTRCLPHLHPRCQATRVQYHPWARLRHPMPCLTVVHDAGSEYAEGRCRAAPPPTSISAWPSAVKPSCWTASKEACLPPAVLLVAGSSSASLPKASRFPHHSLYLWPLPSFLGCHPRCRRRHLITVALRASRAHDY